jgi:hypothetical protein
MWNTTGPALQYPPPEGSYLHKLVCFPDGVTRPATTPYVPREGDLVFFDDHNKKWEFLYWVVGSGPPFHSGIVFRRPDGSMAVLESGPDDSLNVYILDVEPRLHQFKGTIWVRQCKHPLSPEASKNLTDFALAQEGKRYAFWRLILQCSPVRCRAGLRYKHYARTYLDRDAWLCSELVIAAGTVAGLFDPSIHPANAMYPRDFITDHKYPLRHNWEDAAMWRPDTAPVQGSLIPR